MKPMCVAAAQQHCLLVEIRESRCGLPGGGDPRIVSSVLDLGEDSTGLGGYAAHP